MRPRVTVRRVLVSGWIFAAAVLPCRALDIPPAPAGYVSDYAGIISASQRETLNRRLAEFDRTTSNQIFVAIFNSLEGESLEDYTHRLASAWRIGTAKHDNGVLLAVFLKDRRSRIEVGYGLEGALPDAVCAQILRERLAPYFKRGDYAAGVTTAVEAIEAATRGEYRSERSKADTEMIPLWIALLLPLGVSALFFIIMPAPIIIYLFWVAVTIMALPAKYWILIIPVILILEWVRQKWIVPLMGYTIHSKRRRGYRGGYWTDFGTTAGGAGFGGGFGGGGGGFSGGGGGSFGGGGASGSW